MTNLCLFLKQSVGQIKCELAGHDISLEQEEKLFDSGYDIRYEDCDRCGAHLVLEIDHNHKDVYSVKEIQ